MDVFADVYKEVQPSVRVIDWSAARKMVRDQENETKDDSRNGAAAANGTSTELRPVIMKVRRAVADLARWSVRQ